mmetsp:Transcript_24101/g.37191  ORF Transcript_24101/g.37191 Transcript_24101/m.37191 type:complete len:270 (-) Transcript_24101:975-1784(-)
MAPSPISSSTKAALRHLKDVRPHDGWAVEQSTSATGNKTVKLLRRSIPVSEMDFLDLTLTADRCVAGIVNRSAAMGKAKAKVIVEANGSPCRYNREVMILESPSSNTSARSTAAGGVSPLSDEDNQQLLIYAFFAISAAVGIRLLFEAVFMVYIFVFPALYFYALQNCPPADSFEAKKELKRVLRGHHLPEDHPDKPKGFLSQTLNRLQATVATEMATFPGYEVTTTNFAGACIGAKVRVPSVNADLYWVGIFGKWRYIFQTEIPTQRN